MNHQSALKDLNVFFPLELTYNSDTRGERVNYYFRTAAVNKLSVDDTREMS